MRRDWKRRTLAYVVLIALVMGTVYLLSSQRLEVEVVVDLAGARALAGEPLQELTLTISQGEGNHIGSTRYSFPEALFADGPPMETSPVKMELRPGEYEVRVDTLYGTRKVFAGPKRVVPLAVERAGTARIKAAK